MSLKELSPSYYNRLSNVCSAAGSGDSLLNIGCSDGIFERRLQKKFKRLVGMDINPADIGAAKMNAPKNAEFTVADAQNLPFKNSEFDVALCSEVLEHVGDDLRALKEMHRVLKKGGRAVLTVPQRNYPFTYDPINAVLERLTGKHLQLGVWGYGDERVYTEKELKSLLEKAGFKIKKMEFLSHYFLGFCENYIAQILQPLVKSSPSNRPSSKKAVIPAERVPPKPLAAIRDFIISTDNKLFPNSHVSIDIFAEVEKP